MRVDPAMTQTPYQTPHHPMGKPPFSSQMPVDQVLGSAMADCKLVSPPITNTKTLRTQIPVDQVLGSAMADCKLVSPPITNT